MNLLLLRQADFVEPGVDAGRRCPEGAEIRRVRLTGRRLTHAREVLRVEAGDSLRVGLLGGKVGSGSVLSASDEALELAVTLDESPPARPGVQLLLAMPRPKVLRRTLSAAASLGVDRVVLVKTCRVEKFYFDAHVLADANLEEALDLGLEQARDTIRPEVLVRRRFRPFVEDELSAVFGFGPRVLLHPGSEPCGLQRAAEAEGPVTIAVGPEGGFVPFEIDLLTRAGFTPVSLGPRPLRVEVIVSYALGALAALRSRQTR